ncbi:MAG: hypothetical protein WAL49_22960 [Pseudolabrys sp.]
MIRTMAAVTAFVGAFEDHHALFLPAVPVRRALHCLPAGEMLPPAHLIHIIAVAGRPNIPILQIKL